MIIGSLYNGLPITSRDPFQRFGIPSLISAGMLLLFFPSCYEAEILRFCIYLRLSIQNIKT